VPDGCELTPPTKPQPNGVLAAALAPAWRKVLDRGVHGSVAELAEAEKISKGHVSPVLRPVLLAADLVEAILGGWADQRLMLERLERPLPMRWEEQRAALRKGQPDDCKDGRSVSRHCPVQRRGLAAGLRGLRPRGRALRQAPNVT
jgi:hypothetical protein